MGNILYATTRSATNMQTIRKSNSKGKSPKNKKKWYFIPLILLYVLMGVLALFVIALFVFNAIFKPVLVDGSSMEPTLQNGDFLYMQKKSQPKRGDVIVIHAKKDGEPLLVIKRVIALEGDRMFTKDGKLWRQSSNSSEAVDCGEIGESHDPNNFFAPDPFHEVTVAAGQVFVCGDNRENSLDSRTTSFGTLSLNGLEGVVTSWSIEHRATLKKINAFFNKNLLTTANNNIVDKEYLYGESGYCKAV